MILTVLIWLVYAIDTVPTTLSKLSRFLQLDDAIASRAVFVTVSGSDGRADGRKCFLSELNN